jgi:hypothetical protein
MNVSFFHSVMAPRSVQAGAHFSSHQKNAARQRRNARRGSDTLNG